METEQSSGLAAEIEKLQRQQETIGRLELAGAELNSLATRMQKLALIIHRLGLELNHFEGVGSAPKYAAGDLNLPQFRVDGNHYSLVANPASLLGYRDAPELADIINSELHSGRVARNRVELQRVVAFAEVADAESRLHRIRQSKNDEQLLLLEEELKGRKAKLHQLNEQLQQLKN